MSKIALEVLYKKRQELIDELLKMKILLGIQISEIETDIEKISGKRVWESEPELIYDDENANYIKSSQEEI